MESFPVPEQTEPELRRFVFAYRVAIENTSSRTVQLMRRHWIITDADNRVTEVYGDGVVGEQPVLEPGDEYTYSSGAVLETPTGTMEGHYEIESADGATLRIAIPLFILGEPQALH